MDIQIVNPGSKYQAAELIEPAPLGYTHIAAQVRSSSLPFKIGSASKLLKKLKQSAKALEQQDFVESATVYEAVAVPPMERLPYIKDHRDSIRAARFDIAVLIETKSPAAITEVQKTAPYQEMMEALRDESKQMHVIAASNAKRVNDVDKKTGGTFLFNYFVAEDRDVMLKLWDYLAGWYGSEMAVDNSTLLVPVEGEQSDYLAINHARLKWGPKQFIARQMTKRSFWKYVQANLEANRVGAMPVLYRLA
ncbi:hypothetical protein EV207_12248 [Scopulibacillus darangshiensis]|uniref:Uncharacterized protein n=1 Tax=Scopulibacillus darangshiensis TaxID=442528 RepID=A0A4R2NU87_9BACL|nr:hypothetical protein [Scopulibacillus darangshiensis]TCP24945.1 hypothetical protein EV207_12248 [Scopulibacillus darangshiensis]